MIDEKRMNIMVNCSNRDAPYIPVLQASLYENHKDRQVDFYVVHSRITAEQIKLIQDFAERYGQKVVEIVIKDGAFYQSLSEASGLPQFPQEVYYPLLAHKYLPLDMERILCLNIDVAVDDDIQEFYNADFHDQFFIASQHGTMALTPENTIVRNDSYEKEAKLWGFFNTGVFVINLSKMREANIGESFYNGYIDELRLKYPNDKPLFGADQGLLNFCFYDKIYYFAENRKMYNYEGNWSGNWADIHPKIVHYSGDISNQVGKPWHYRFNESDIKWKNYSIRKDRYPFLLDQNRLDTFEVWWKYAKLAPNYEELLRVANENTAILRKSALSAISAFNRLVDQTLDTDFRLDKIIQPEFTQFVKLPILSVTPKYRPLSLYNPYTWRIERNEEYIRYFSVRSDFTDEWMKFPLMASLQEKKNYVLKLKVRANRDVAKLDIFLSNAKRAGLHVAPTNLKSNQWMDFEIPFTPTSDDFLCLCFSSFSFRGGLILDVAKMEITEIVNNVSDGFSANLKMEQNFDEIVDDFCSKLTGLTISGYSVAQYCADRGGKGIVLISEEHYWPLISIVGLSFVDRQDVVIKKCFSTQAFKKTYVFEYYNGQLGFEKIESSNINNITANDIVLILKFSVDASILAHCKRVGAIVIQMDELVNNMQEYVLKIRPLADFAYRHPKVTTIAYKDPINYLHSEDEKKLAKLQINGGKVTQLVKEGKFPLELFERRGYTYAQSCALLFDPKKYFDNTNVLRIVDYESELVNIRDGHRVTINQPNTASRIIWFVGDCRIYGSGVPDTGTSSSQLQSLLNASHPEKTIRVENFGMQLWNRYWDFFNVLNNLPVKDGDIVITCYGVPNNYYEFLDLSELYKDPVKYGEVWAFQWHQNENGYRGIAEAIFNHLEENNFYENYDKTEKFASLRNPVAPPHMPGFRSYSNSFIATQSEKPPPPA